MLHAEKRATLKNWEWPGDEVNIAVAQPGKSRDIHEGSTNRDYVNARVHNRKREESIALSLVPRLSPGGEPGNEAISH